MANPAKDKDELHDPLDQYADENELAKEEIEQASDTFERKTPEESAMNTDNETAEEATEATEDEITPKDLENFEAAEVAIEAAEERKHKTRESTSEKAKKAAVEREKKGQQAEPVSKKQLDPLRLRGKKYRAAVKDIDRTARYTAEEALELARKTAYASFDAAVELHAKVKTEGARGTITLPHGNGKTKKVAVADDDTIEKIAAGTYDFDVLLATPAQMPKLAKYAKALGPKGLMPSPKAGTVTDDVEKVKEEIGKGRIEYRADKTGVIHLSIGRLSFSDEQLLENFRAMEAILVPYKVLSLSLASTMGPGFKVSLG
jgi:large subunit ribosomal protein L1